MSSDYQSWERLNRKALYDSRFMKFWEDTVKLPNGEVFDDYSIAWLPDGVIVVATDENGDLLVMDEYKYAIDETILTFVACGVDGSEPPIDVARRELLEETGYTADSFEAVSSLSIYPSKVVHKTTIVRAKNIKKVAEPRHEASESISNIRMISSDEAKQLLNEGKFKTTYLIAALAMTLPEILQ